MPLDLDGAPRHKAADTGLLSQRLPPCNMEAEQAVLGALLANNKAYDRLGTLRPHHFADPIHGRIFDAVAKRIEAGQLADAVTLKTEFEHSGVLDEVGGVAYLAQLLGAMVGIINAGEYGRAIQDAWVRRQAIEVGTELVNEAFHSTNREADGASVISAGIARLLALAENADAAERTSSDLGQAADVALRNADAAGRGERSQSCLWTGIRTFDEVWGGLWPGELSYFAARSGTGKTPAMAAIARNVASKIAATDDPGCVHIISLEMPADALANISMAALTGMAVDRIRQGRLSRDEWAALLEHQKAMERLPIVIDDPAGATLGSIVTLAHLTHRMKKTRLLLIDYLEMISKDKEHQRMQQPEWIPYIGNQIKKLAKALGIPVIMLRQINKSRDREASTRPTIGDLPFDGGQAADVTVALWREEIGVSDDPPSSVRGDAERVVDERRKWTDWRNSIRGRAQFGALRRRVGPAGQWKRGWFDGPRMLWSDEEPAKPDEANDIPY